MTQGQQRQREELVFIQSLYDAKPLLKESGSVLSIPFPLSPTPDNSSGPKKSCVVSNQKWFFYKQGLRHISQLILEL